MSKTLQRKLSFSNFLKKKPSIIHEPISEEPSKKNPIINTMVKKFRKYDDLYSDEDKSENIDTFLEEYSKNEKIICNICNNEHLENNMYNVEYKGYVIVSCCNKIYHVQCIVKFLKLNFNNNYIQENINISYFSNMKCHSCNTVLQKLDILTIISKYIDFNKNNLNLKLSELIEQKQAIETEIQDIQNYNIKIENERINSQKLLKILYMSLI